jgi:prophage regulatory protein
MQKLSNLDSRILRLPDVKKRVRLSRSSIYAMAATGTFPKPIPLGIRSVGWLEAEVAEWISQRTAKRGGAK